MNIINSAVNFHCNNDYVQSLKRSALLTVAAQASSFKSPAKLLTFAALSGFFYLTRNSFYNRVNKTVNAAHSQICNITKSNTDHSIITCQNGNDAHEKVTQSIIELDDDDKVTKNCMKFEASNYKCYPYSRMDDSSCGKTARAVCQLVGEKFHKSNKIYSNPISWENLLASMKENKKQIYLFSTYGCPFHKSDGSTEPFNGHTFSVIQYDNQHYQLCQSYLFNYYLSDFMRGLGKRIMSYEELVRDVLKPMQILATHEGPWTKEVTDAFYKITQVPIPEMIGTTPPEKRLPFSISKIESGTWINQYFDKITLDSALNFIKMDLIKDLALTALFSFALRF